MKLVRALRRGWIKRDGQQAPKEPETYLMWDDDFQAGDKTSAGAPAVQLRSCCPRTPAHPRAGAGVGRRHQRGHVQGHSLARGRGLQGAAHNSAL